ncbi:GTP-binding protein, partial [Escherichia coli]
MTRTNLITGFLGSGKTTSILHLLAHKDPNERWAVLVNEFGEVGIIGDNNVCGSQLVTEVFIAGAFFV